MNFPEVYTGKFGKYKKIEKISHGGQSTVYLFEDITNQIK
jgi:hypothetical protein